MGCNSSKATAVEAPKSNGPAENNGKPTIYGNFASPFVRGAVMAAKESGIDFNFHELDMLAGEHKSEWYMKINPKGTVPAMVDGDITICESADIAIHFAKKAGSSLYPDDAEKQEKIGNSIQFVQSQLFDAVKSIMLPVFSGTAVHPSALATLKSYQETLNKNLEGKDFLSGSEMSLGDIFVFSLMEQCTCGPDFKPENLPNLEAWKARIRAKTYYAEVHKKFFTFRTKMHEKVAAAKAAGPTIYYHPASPFSRAVDMVASELKILINVHPLDLATGEHKQEWYLKINPAGTVPAMVHGDKIITESSEIAKYFVETFAKGNALYPEDAEIQKKIEFGLNYCQTDMKGPVGALVGGAFTGGSTSAETVEALHKVYNFLATSLGEKQFLAGDEMTLADIFIFNMLLSTLMDPNFKRPENIDNLRAYAHRMMALDVVKVGKAQFDVIKNTIIEASSPTLYVSYFSPVSRSAIMVAKALGVHVNIKVLDLLTGEHKQPEYLAINPNGTVPAMVHGETKITESLDIAKYLASTFGNNCALYPTEGAEKEFIDKSLDFSVTIFAILGRLIAPLFGGAPPQTEIHPEMHEKQVHVNENMKGDFLTGDCLTLADIFVFNNFMQTKMDPTFKVADNTDKLQAWAGKMKALPCVEPVNTEFLNVIKTLQNNSTSL